MLRPRTEINGYCNLRTIQKVLLHNQTLNDMQLRFSLLAETCLNRCIHVDSACVSYETLNVT